VTEAGTEVAAQLEVAESAWKRFLGLMGRRSLPPGQGLMIRPCNSIHMFFMRFPLDVAFLDGEGRVLRLYHGIRPWRVSRIVVGAKAAVELPAGALAAAGVERGTRLDVV
jgi:uncharacterized membrane protein (UPF0127 family)